MNFSKIKKIAVGVIALLALIVAYVAYEHPGIVQSQREAEFRAAEAQRERENREAFSAYLDSHIPADAYKLLASINGHSVLMTDGEAEVSYRVLFDFEIPYVAEMVIPVIQDATVETGIPLNTLSVQCYAESNQNGIEDGSMVSWRTHDLVSGTFVSGPDDYLMPGATMDDLYAYFSDGQKAVERILNERTIQFNFGSRSGTYIGDENENGLPDGYGTFESKNDDGTSWTYEGNWVGGHWNGQGKTTWSNGYVYDGEYLNDVESGKGIYTLPDGKHFDGTFVSGEFKGDGVLYFTDGSSFIGQFENFDTAVGTYVDTGGQSFDASLQDGIILLNDGVSISK
ncbi:MAG: hypothetical protein IJT94_00955 [Oscillibacter sp.]|nr:hypothetical protein [Oscillibacter sp.]